MYFRTNEITVSISAILKTYKGLNAVYRALVSVEGGKTFCLRFSRAKESVNIGGGSQVDILNALSEHLDKTKAVNSLTMIMDTIETNKVPAALIETAEAHLESLGLKLYWPDGDSGGAYRVVKSIGSTFDLTIRCTCKKLKESY